MSERLSPNGGPDTKPGPRPTATDGELSELPGPESGTAGKGPGQSLASSAGTLGMIIFLVALGVLFTASLVGYLVVRLRAHQWPPPGSPRLPGGLWISTVILLLSSVTMKLALSSARWARTRALARWLGATALLGIGFLVSQTLNWAHLLVGQHLAAQSNLYGFTFYMLTGLHGLHVIGGLIPLGIATVRAIPRRPGRPSYDGVRYLSMYWHFLDGVWLVLFAVLLIAA